jgi:hypothetical protein
MDIRSRCGFAFLKLFARRAARLNAASVLVIAVIAVIAACGLPSKSFAQKTEDVHPNVIVSDIGWSRIQQDLARGCRPKGSEFPKIRTTSPGIGNPKSVNYGDYSEALDKWQKLPLCPPQGSGLYIPSAGSRPVTGPAGSYRIELHPAPLPPVPPAPPYRPPGSGTAVEFSEPVAFPGVTETFIDFYVGATHSKTNYRNGTDASGNPISLDPSTSTLTDELEWGGVVGARVDVDIVHIEFNKALDTALKSGSSGYAPEDKPKSGFPAVLPTKAPPKPVEPPPRITLNAELGIYGFFGSQATINGIPGGPGITPTGSDSFNFRDNFMITAGGAIVVPVTPAWTVTLTGGFAAVDKTVTFNCVTFCENGLVVPTFSDAKNLLLPSAYVGGRMQWPFPILGIAGAKFSVEYTHVFVGSRNVTLGSVAQNRIVSFNVAQDLDLFTAGVSIPLR